MPRSIEPMIVMNGTLPNKNKVMECSLMMENPNQLIVSLIFFTKERLKKIWWFIKLVKIIVV
jgi:hypothetical protein